MTEIGVADDGPGIPKDQIDRALARGGRLDNLGATTGLGIAIVSDIAEAWRGRIAFNSGPAGFEVSFESRPRWRRPEEPAMHQSGEVVRPDQSAEMGA